jgi:hypothetical protein
VFPAAETFCGSKEVHNNGFRLNDNAIHLQTAVVRKSLDLCHDYSCLNISSDRICNPIIERDYFKICAELDILVTTEDYVEEIGVNS